MKKILLLATILCSFFISFAQSELLVQQGEKGLFLNHTVVPKESFYSVGRLYNIHPKEIAAFNSLDMDKGLNIGQVIRIPLVASNFSQSAPGNRAVYYVVGEKEGLYRVSVKNNNVLMADLRKWNRLTDDQLAQGQKLIVGYLVSGEAANIAASVPATEVKETVKEVPVQKTPPVVEAAKQDALKEKPMPAEEKKPAPVAAKPASQQGGNNSNGGYFKSLFDAQVRTQPVTANETMSAGIFKTSSGWQDAKYYVLIDKVEPGTIVRITNPSNSRSVYAKVLGEMSGIRQNQGYDLRLSNAAASALEVSDEEKFIVRVQH